MICFISLQAKDIDLFVRKRQFVCNYIRHSYTVCENQQLYYCFQDDDSLMVWMPTPNETKE